ncbi:MAG: hypothetical protein GY851_24145 [bacterium]|nr:hypothetical protein [bacterium]
MDKNGESMLYRYAGFLSTVLDLPECAPGDDVDHLSISSGDLAKWATRDLDSEREWQKVPAQRTPVEDAVSLVAEFEDMGRMDALGVDDPRYWAPLGSLDWEDERLPIDTATYPIVEVTFRCTSDNAHPALVLYYGGGSTKTPLPMSRRWQTVAFLAPHLGFPSKISDIVFRLYSTTRTRESVEIRDIRFRAATPAESQALAKGVQMLENAEPPCQYPLLDEFLPLGVVMDAGGARRLAEMLGVSLAEYWELAFEDVVTHHHNCVAMESAEQLTTPEWRELLSFAERYGLKLVPSHDLSIDEDMERLEALIEQRVRPSADSPAILAWNVRNDPRPEETARLLKVRDAFSEADASHPSVIVTADGGPLSLYAPFFPVTNASHFTTHAPWEVGELVRAHIGQVAGQQLWVTGPAFIHATGAPEWNSCPEMRLMINTAFATGARGWFTHAYHNDPIWVAGTCQRTLTGPFLAFSDLWLELDRRMDRFSALAPLFLGAKPVSLPDRWYVTSGSSTDRAQIPEGVAPTSSYRLNGSDYSIFCVVSNDVQGMSSLSIDIPRQALRGQDIIVLTDFVQNRVWAPMNLERHLEMFPGQSQIVLVAQSDVCTRWRDAIARRLVEDDARQMSFNLRLAEAYELDTSLIHGLIEEAGSGDPLASLEKMDRARDELLDLVYQSPAICESRSAVIKAGSAICACDGALCRLLNRGKSDEAHELGTRVIPLAREITNLRLEIRQGRGGAVLDHCKGLGDRALALLAEIRGAI